MDLNAIAPIIENKFKEALAEKRYPFGFAKKQGISNKIATGSLYNSVKVSVVPGNNTEIIQITMNDYGQWVQSGRLNRASRRRSNRRSNKRNRRNIICHSDTHKYMQTVLIVIHK